MTVELLFFFRPAILCNRLSPLNMFAVHRPSLHSPAKARPSLLSEAQKSKLCWLNLLAGLIHGAMAIVTLAVSNLDLRVPVWWSKVTTEIVYASNASNASRDGLDVYTKDVEGWTFAPGRAQVVGYHNLALATAAFFLVTCIGHLGVVPKSPWREFYHHSLDHGQWVGRWIEYAITAPIMFTILIAYFCGVIDLVSVLATWTLMAVTMACGFLMELTNPPHSRDAWRAPVDASEDARFAAWRGVARWAPTCLGWVTYAIAWAIALVPGVPILGEPNVPRFVPLIVGVEALLFTSFGVVQLVTYLRAPKHFVASEMAYILLSLTSKVFLGGFVLANVLVLGSFAEIWTA